MDYRMWSLIIGAVILLGVALLWLLRRVFSSPEQWLGDKVDRALKDFYKNPTEKTARAILELLPKDAKGVLFKDMYSDNRPVPGVLSNVFYRDIGWQVWQMKDVREWREQLRRKK